MFEHPCRQLTISWFVEDAVRGDMVRYLVNTDAPGGMPRSDRFG